MYIRFTFKNVKNEPREKNYSWISFTAQILFNLSVTNREILNDENRARMPSKRSEIKIARTYQIIRETNEIAISIIFTLVFKIEQIE